METCISIIPKLLPIKKAAIESNLPEYTIRRLYLEGKLIGIRSGKKILINIERLSDYLNNTKSK